MARLGALMPFEMSDKDPHIIARYRMVSSLSYFLHLALYKYAIIAIANTPGLRKLDAGQAEGGS